MTFIPQLNPREQGWVGAVAKKLHVSPNALAEPAALEGRPLGDALDALDQAIAEAGADELPAFVGRLVELEERARLRLRTEIQATPNGQPSKEAERWLTPAEAAALFKVTPRWLNRATRAQKLRFRRQLSGRLVRYEEGGLRRWLVCRA